MDIESLAMNSKVKTSTIRRKWKEVPGITKSEAGLVIQDGTRWPLAIGRYKHQTFDEKRWLILLAIENLRYIDARMLGIEQSQFEALIGDLLKSGFIRENGLGNHFGANAYDSTPTGADALAGKKKAVVSKIAESVAACSGIVVGRIISELYASSQ